VHREGVGAVAIGGVENSLHDAGKGKREAMCVYNELIIPWGGGEGRSRAPKLIVC
jgi:hypothetical protein